jgi:hypothetical protein
MSSFDDAHLPIGMRADSRLPRGLSLIVILGLSLLAWAAVIALALAVSAVL